MWWVKSLLGFGSEEATQAESPKDSPPSLCGALYSVDGLNFERLLSCCAVSVETDENDAFPRIVLVEIFEKDDDSSPTSDKEPQCYEFPIHRLSNFQQHLADAFQFIDRLKKDHAEEYGLQFDTVAMAEQFRQIVEPHFSASARILISLPCGFAEYQTTEKQFVSLTTTAEVAIAQRPADFEAFLIVRDEKNAILYQDVLSPNMQLWAVPKCAQVIFWGPALRYDPEKEKTEDGPDNTGDPPSRRMYMVELLVSEEDKQCAEFFRLLGTVLQERAQQTFLSKDQQAKMENSVQAHLKIDNCGDEDNSPLDVQDAFRGNNLDDEYFDSKETDDDSYDASVIGWDSHENSEAEEDEEIRPRGSSLSRRKSRNPTELLHKFMEVGSDRTFVCRGSDGRSKQVQLQVYRNPSHHGDALGAAGLIDTNKFQYNNTPVYPSLGVLHDSESKLLLTNNQNDEEIYMMDLERETIVQKWETNNQPINNVVPKFKFGQQSHDPTVLCHNNRNIFMMDTRLKDQGQSTTISYLTNPQFSTAATDENGHVLVGSKLGALRLYDGLPNAKGDLKRAKTQLDTIREPLTFVDVTSDGSWILGTTRAYLVVFPTKMSNSGKTGFEIAMGQHKPPAHYLKLKPRDVQKYDLQDINFTPAKFSSDEASIVTSTGNLAVVWDMKSIRRGKPRYTVKAAHHPIKDVKAATEDPSSVVVAYPHELGLFGTTRRSIQ